MCGIPGDLTTPPISSLPVFSISSITHTHTHCLPISSFCTHTLTHLHGTVVSLSVIIIQCIIILIPSILPLCLQERTGTGPGQDLDLTQISQIIIVMFLAFFLLACTLLALLPCWHCWHACWHAGMPCWLAAWQPLIFSSTLDNLLNLFSSLLFLEGREVYGLGLLFQVGFPTFPTPFLLAPFLFLFIFLACIFIFGFIDPVLAFPLLLLPSWFPYLCWWRFSIALHSTTTPAHTHTHFPILHTHTPDLPLLWEGPCPWPGQTRFSFSLPMTPHMTHSPSPIPHRPIIIPGFPLGC